VTHHPITPPPELVHQWVQEARSQDYCSITEQVAFHAAQWGADQELEAICERLRYLGWHRAVEDIRAARHPKPKSEKQQALDAFDRIEYAPSEAEDFATILRAIKSIPDDQ
jgi:hypothetical protein